MALAGKYRHELKYAIGEGEYRALKSRLASVMQPDAHARADGSYLIRSIYFDNYRDKALREKLDGVQQREKFRIRWYCDDLSFIALEKKVKRNDLCQKLSAPLDREELEKILFSPGEWMRAHPQPLVQELFFKMRTQQLRPRVQVSYLREAYVYAPGNVRITFDSDLRTSLFCTAFLRAPDPNLCAADTPDARLLEVKFDEFLPDVIAGLLQTGCLRQQAFSKYAACRRFG